MSSSAAVIERNYGAPSALVNGAQSAKCDRHVFVICGGETCRNAGSNRLLGLLRHRCSHEGGHQDVRISSSRCLGRCGLAPAIVEDGRVLGWVSLRRLKSELMRLGLFSTAS